MLQVIHLTHTEFLFNSVSGSSHCGSGEMNPTAIHEDAGLIPGPAQQVKDTKLP